MPSSPKVLGQVTPIIPTAPPGQTIPVLTPIYTAPAAPGLGAVTSSLTVCNTGNTGVLFSVRVAPASAADSAQQAVYDQVPLGPHETFTATIGMSLAPTDQIRVWASLLGVSFSLFGTELS